jgi:hypothetical protein
VGSVGAATALRSKAGAPHGPSAPSALIPAATLRPRGPLFTRPPLLSNAGPQRLVLGWAKRYDPKLDAAHQKVQSVASMASIKSFRSHDHPPHNLAPVVEMV